MNHTIYRDLLGNLPSFLKTKNVLKQGYFYYDNDLDNSLDKKSFDFENWKHTNIYFEDRGLEYLKILDQEERLVQLAFETSENQLSLEQTLAILEKHPDFLSKLSKTSETQKEKKVKKLSFFKKDKKLKRERPQTPVKFWKEIEDSLKIDEKVLEKINSFSNVDNSRIESSTSLLKPENFDYLNFDLHSSSYSKYQKKRNIEVYISDVLYEIPNSAVLFEEIDIFNPFDNWKVSSVEKMQLKLFPDLSKEYDGINKAIDQAIDFYFSHEMFEGEFDKLKN